MMNLERFCGAGILLIFMMLNAIEVNGSACGCPENYNNPKVFKSYIWDDFEQKFVEVLLTDVNGQAVFEGDVIVGATAEMKNLAKTIGNSLTGETITPQSLEPQFKDLIAGHRNGRSAWKDNIVPYSLSPYLMRTGRRYRRNERLRRQVEDAIKLWEDGTGLTFKNVTSENSPSNRRMIRFRKSDDSTCSWTYKTGVADVAGSCIRHEIGHALGLAHEHNRNGRDEFVTVNRENIKTNHCSQFAESTLASRLSGAYDFSSIMHYRATTFSCNGKPTLTAIAPNRINRTNNISAGDFQAVRELHGIPQSNAPAK